MPGMKKENLLHPWQNLRCRFQDKNAKINLLIATGLIGMVLLCLSEWLPASSQTSPATLQTEELHESQAASYAQDLENRLQQLIESVDGAGPCRVMVTVSEGEQTVYATDTDQGENSARSEHVLLGDEALIESVKVPRIQGVAVLCEGGNDTSVQNTITELVRSLTGIGANHITVTKMVTSQ